MDVVLVRPLHRFGKAVFRSNRRVFSLGILSVATSLDAAGYRVRIIDQQSGRGWKRLLLDELKKGPVCVGVGCMTGPQIRHALDVSRLVKENSRVPVVWGGTHPSLLPAQTLENENIDMVVQGEGEETFVELVRALERGTPIKDVEGVWYKENGQIKANPPRPFIDLNEQPPLAYYLLDIKKYLESRFGHPLLRTFSSRGCQYKCSFCYNSNLNQGKWRALTAEETVKRVKGSAEAYGVKGFLFCDDNFFGDIKRAREILEGLIREGLDIVLYKLDIRTDILTSLDDDFLTLLKRSGCINLSIGLESGSERVLGLLNKNITVSEVMATNRRLKAFGIAPSYTFMMGYPTETLEELRQTVDLMLRLCQEYPDANCKLHTYTPLPGTELFELGCRHGLKEPARLEDWIPFNYNVGDLPWLSADRKRLIKMLHFCTVFVGGGIVDPTVDIHPFLRLLAKVYRPLARLRVERFYYKFPVEIRLAEWLGLYKRQT